MNRPAQGVRERRGGLNSQVGQGSRSLSAAVLRSRLSTGTRHQPGRSGTLGQSIFRAQFEAGGCLPFAEELTRGGVPESGDSLPGGGDDPVCSRMKGESEQPVTLAGVLADERSLGESVLAQSAFASRHEQRRARSGQSGDSPDRIMRPIQGVTCLGEPLLHVGGGPIFDLGFGRFPDANHASLPRL